MGKKGCRVTLASKGPEGEAVNCQDIGPVSWPEEEVGEEQPALGRSSRKMIPGIASVPEPWQEQAKGVSRIEGRGFVAAVLTRRRLENSGRVTVPSAQSITPGALRTSFGCSPPASLLLHLSSTLRWTSHMFSISSVPPSLLLTHIPGCPLPGPFPCPAPPQPA